MNNVNTGNKTAAAHDPSDTILVKIIKTIAKIMLRAESVRINRVSQQLLSLLNRQRLNILTSFL